jgi:hypothetical protein
MPIDPIPVEPLVEIALELRTQTVEKIKESKTI